MEEPAEPFSPLAKLTLTDETKDMDRHLVQFLSHKPNIFRTNKIQKTPNQQLKFGVPKIPKHVPISKDQKQLPAYASRIAILNSIEQHPVLIVAGETGSGKSTQIRTYSINYKIFKLICSENNGTIGFSLLQT